MRLIIRILLIVFVAFLAVVVTRPSTFHIERSATINASSDVVYAELEDYHKFAAWSPWEKLDSAMKKEFSGPESGVGASYFWSGNSKAGEGRMTITEAHPTDKVVMKLEFLKPFKATNTTTFALGTDGAGTKVTWSMDGTNNFMGKMFSVFVNMDKTIGGDFERGLAQLKVVCEVAPSLGNAVPRQADGTTTTH